MIADYAKQRQLITNYAQNYHDERFQHKPFNAQLAGEMSDFLYDATLDQIYDACQFVNENEINYRYGDPKNLTKPDSEMTETYHILGMHFWGNLRNRLYEYNRTGKRDFYNLIANEEQNIAHSIHSLQKTYTECYGLHANGQETAEQRNLQRELAIHQSKLALAQHALSYAPKRQELSFQSGREQ